jgi:hypothetical protein
LKYLALLAEALCSTSEPERPHNRVAIMWIAGLAFSVEAKRLTLLMCPEGGFGKLDRVRLPMVKADNSLQFCHALPFAFRHKRATLHFSKVRHRSCSQLTLR